MNSSGLLDWGRKVSTSARDTNTAEDVKEDLVPEILAHTWEVGYKVDGVGG